MTNPVASLAALLDDMPREQAQAWVDGDAAPAAEWLLARGVQYAPREPGCICGAEAGFDTACPIHSAPREPPPDSPLGFSERRGLCPTCKGAAIETRVPDKELEYWSTWRAVRGRPEGPAPRGHNVKIAIVGSRDFGSLELVCRYVESLPADTIVVTGGARGVDRCAENMARAREMRVEVFPADWTRHGKSAGFRRNAQIVGYADKVVAFWDGVSPGTKHTIGLARIAGKLDQLFMDAGSRSPDPQERTNGDT